MFGALVIFELLASLAAAVSMFSGMRDYAIFYMVMATWAVAQQVYIMVREGRK